MKKEIYTVTYDNEVLAILDNYIELKDYLWSEFGHDIQEYYDDDYITIDRDDCVEVCGIVGVKWQKFEIEI